jgi:transposase
MNKHKHTIQFSRTELSQIQAIIQRGKHHTRVVTRARILLLTSQGEGKDGIAVQLGIGRSTVQRTRDHYRAGGLNRALYDAPRPGQPPKLDDNAEAHLVAIACSDAPEGRDHWTLELLQERMIADKKVKTISTVAIWKHLKKRGIKPWREKNVVHSRLDA